MSGKDQLLRRLKLVKKHFNNKGGKGSNYIDLKINGSSNKQLWPLISSGMKGMMGGSSLETVSRYARWFLDGSCGNNHTVLRSAVAVLNRSITIRPSMKRRDPHLTSWHCKMGWFVTKTLQLKESKWVVSNYHKVFKFPVKLLEFAWEFLWKDYIKRLDCSLVKNNFDTDRYPPPRSDSICTLLGYSVP